MSQATDDNVCLQHALCWLYRVAPFNQDKLIERSVAKSHDLHLTYTTCIGIQSFAQYATLISGHPYLIFDTITKGDVINCQPNLRDIISNSYAVRSALWQFFGKSEMSMLWSQLLLYLNIKTSNDNKDFYGEPFCLALCNIANNLLLQGRYNLVNTILGFAKEKFPNEPLSHIWMLSESLSVFVKALHNENWIEAKGAANKILVFDKWEGYLRLAELHFYRQDFVTANKFIDIIITRFQSNNKYKLKIVYYVRAKILLAEIQCASSYPDKVSPGIITLLNNCLILTEKYNLEYYSAIIQMHIAHIQLDLGLKQHSMRTVEKCRLKILTHGGCFDRARVLLLYAKTLLEISTIYSKTQKVVFLKNIVQLLEGAKKNFRAVEAVPRLKDVLFLQVRADIIISLLSQNNSVRLKSLSIR